MSAMQTAKNTIAGSTLLCLSVLIPLFVVVGGVTDHNDYRFIIAMLACAVLFMVGDELLFGEGSTKLISAISTLPFIGAVSFRLAGAPLDHPILMIFVAVNVFGLTVGIWLDRKLVSLSTSMPKAEPKPIFREQKSKIAFLRLTGRMGVFCFIVIGLLFSPLTIAALWGGVPVLALIFNLPNLLVLGMSGFSYWYSDKIARMTPDEYHEHETKSLERRTAIWEKEQSELNSEATTA
jgi:hypothetical protein